MHRSTHRCADAVSDNSPVVRSQKIFATIFYSLIEGGKAPRTIKLGATLRITEDADAEWVREREAETAQANQAA